MPLFPASSLWADVYPDYRRWQKYFLRIARTTVPFVAIAVIACVIDLFTSFPVEMGVTPYEVGGGILGVFLVLRTNSGYERWWEARKLWGSITNQSRSLATAAIAYGANDQWKEEFVHWTILFSHATRHRLREESDFPEMAMFPTTRDCCELTESSHCPIAVTFRLAKLLQEAAARDEIPPAFLMQMERDRISLLDYLGGCERILGTPVPKAYTIAIRQFLVLFLAAFPFGILQSATWLTPLVTAFVAFPMLALDEIGSELQNPFSSSNINHLPLDTYCKNIESNLLELLSVNSQVASADE